MYRETLAVLAAEKVRVALLRDDLCNINNISELDILIDIESLHKVQDVLIDNGWVVFNKDGYGFNRKSVAVKVVNSCSYLLDIHASLIQDDIIYLDNEWFFHNCLKVDEFLYQPSPVAFLYHMVMHVVLGKESLHPKYVSRLEFFQLSTVEEKVLLDVAKKYGLEDVFKGVIFNPVKVLSDKKQVQSFKQLSRKTLVKRDPGYWWRKNRKRLFRIISPLFGCRRGLTIAFIGPDGAGKSTFINELERKLKDMGLSTRNAYMGPWFRSKFFTTLILESVGANPLDEICGLEQVNSPLQRFYKKAKGLVRRYLYYINLPVEIYYRYFRYVYLQSLKGRVVLMDRYVHDIELGFKNKQVNNNQGLRRLIVKASPTPDILVLLYNDPEVIWKRKKQHELKEIRWAMDRYFELAENYKGEEIKTDIECRVLVDKFIEDHWVDIYKRKADSWFSVSKKT